MPNPLKFSELRKIFGRSLKDVGTRAQMGQMRLAKELGELVPGSKIYVSGAMSGLPGKNIGAFKKAENYLTNKGFKVLNPADAEKSVPAMYPNWSTMSEKRQWGAYMRHDLNLVKEADAVLTMDRGSFGTLRSSTLSRGAKQEVSWAKQMNKPVLRASRVEPTYGVMERADPHAKPLTAIDKSIEYERMYGAGSPNYAPLDVKNVAAGAVANPWDVKTIPLSTRVSDRSARVGGRRAQDVTAKVQADLRDARGNDVWGNTGRNAIEQDREALKRQNLKRNAQIQTIYSYPPGRPSTNVNPIGGRIPGMEEGGLAAKRRKFFGWNGPHHFDAMRTAIEGYYDRLIHGKRTVLPNKLDVLKKEYGRIFDENYTKIAKQANEILAQGANWATKIVAQRDTHSYGSIFSKLGNETNLTRAKRASIGIWQGLERTKKFSSVAFDEMVIGSIKGGKHFLGEIGKGIAKGDLLPTAYLYLNVGEMIASHAEKIPHLLGSGGGKLAQTLLVGAVSKTGYLALKNQSFVRHAYRFLKSVPESKRALWTANKEVVLPAIKNYLIHGEENMVSSYVGAGGGVAGKKAAEQYVRTQLGPIVNVYDAAKKQYEDIGKRTGDIWDNIGSMEKDIEHIVKPMATELMNRPISNIKPIGGWIEGMAHGGWAAKLRKALTTFSSPHRGIWAVGHNVFKLYGRGNKLKTFTIPLPNIVSGFLKKLDISTTIVLQDIKIKGLYLGSGGRQKYSELLRESLSKYKDSPNLRPRVQLRNKLKRQLIESHIKDLEISEKAGIINPILIQKGKSSGRGLRGYIKHERTHQIEDIANEFRPTSHPAIKSISLKSKMILGGSGYDISDNVIMHQEMLAFGHQFQYESRFKDMAIAGNRVKSFHEEAIEYWKLHGNPTGKKRSPEIDISKLFMPKMSFSTRPSTNINPIGGRIVGMPEGGLAAKIRRFFGFGSPWQGLEKLGATTILEKVSQAFSKLTGGNVSKIWEMPEAAFVKGIQEGKAGIMHLDIEGAFTTHSLAGARNVQKEAGILKPGFVSQHVPATPATHEARYTYYNTPIGATKEEGLRTAGFSVMSRSPGGEWVRSGLAVAEDFRGKGANSLAGTLSRRMFEEGALIPDSLSTAGAKSFHRQLTMIAKEAAEKGTRSSSKAIMRNSVENNAMISMGRVNNAQTRNTIPGLHSSLHQSRGIRKGPSGGNG